MGTSGIPLSPIGGRGVAVRGSAGFSSERMKQKVLKRLMHGKSCDGY